MVEISRFYSIVISIFYEVGERHHRPHIHVQAGDRAASVAISDGAILAGKLPTTVHRVIRAFVKLRKVELMQAWHDTQNGKRPTKVAPVRLK